MEGIFLEITIIICLAALLSIFFRLLKQPAITAYILTGILLGPFGLFHLEHHLTLETLGKLGVTFLLFMLGLELKLRELKTIGFPALVVGTLQMWFTFFLGFYVSLMLGYSMIVSVYVGIALSFSSTILIVKNLSDRKDLNSLYGKLSIGILLMQDFFAVFIMIFLTGITPGGEASIPMTVTLIIIKAVLLFSLILFASIHIIPKLIHYIARSEEILFLFSLAWVFLLTGIIASPVVGFSSEIGGFLAGLALANSAENFQIVARMKALRDFFITIFFVMIGLSVTFDNFSAIIFPGIVLLFFVSVIKPLLIMLLVKVMNYRKRTSFLVGNSMGQISEFSFLILFIGQKLGYVENSLVTTILFVGIASFLTSSYVIQRADKLYNLLELRLGFLHVDNSNEKKMNKNPLHNLKNHIVIVGGHQMGQRLLHELEEEIDKIVVVDFDPDIIKKLEHNYKNIVFGDIADPEIQGHVHLDKAKLVISTAPDVEDNLLLLEAIQHTNKRAKVIVMALENEDAKALYKAGADYVVLPHLAGGRYLARMLKDNHLDNLDWHKARDLVYIS